MNKDLKLPTVQQVQGFFSKHDLGGIDPEFFLQSLRKANGKDEQRIPKVGEIVLFTANPDDVIAHSNHNNDEIPAIVTRAWSATCINCKIIPDCGAMQDRTSVVHFSTNPAGYHFRFMDEEKKPSIPVSQGEESKDASSFLKSNT